jgi:transposase-like protein
MITETRTCHACGRATSVRNGRNAAGTQRYTCKNCGVTRVLDRIEAHARLDQTTVERADRERTSLRATARMFGVSHETSATMLKKSPGRRATHADQCARTPDEVLEVDALFPFVRWKRNQRRSWLAHCRRTRQILACWIGAGSLARWRARWRQRPYA